MRRTARLDGANDALPVLLLGFSPSGTNLRLSPASVAKDPRGVSRADESD